MKRGLLPIFSKYLLMCIAGMLMTLTASGQKLPFQGKLLENDELVNGTKTFTFSIAARSWTEEHPAISVLDGYYSVVLGEFTPLPDELFQGVDSETMTITVDGQSLGEVQLYKPIGTSSAFKDQDSEVSETIAAFQGEITGTGVWGDQLTIYAGVRGLGNALNGGNAGVLGEAEAAAGNLGFTYGVYGLSSSSVADATGYGVRGEAGGTYSFGVGVRGIGANRQSPVTPDNPNPNLNNYGGNFTATGNPYGNMGVYGRASTDENNPDALNFAVFGEAFGPNPENNWAGFFNGNVNVNGDLNVQGNLNANINPSIESVDIFNFDNNGQIFGGINLRDDATETQVTDNLRTSLEVGRTTNGKSMGALRIRGPVDGGGGFPASMVNLDIQDDPRDLIGMAGRITLDASEGGASPIPNIHMGGKSWENNNLPYFQMYGSHDNGDQWYHNGLTLSMNANDIQQWGSFELFQTSPGAGNIIRTVWLDGENGTGVFSGDLRTDGALFSADGVVQVSDQRLKRNVLPLNQTLAKINQLRGVSYYWKDEERSQRMQIGLIAQEVEAVFPEFVVTKEDGYKAVNYSQMVAVLIEAIKEMNGTISALESKVNALAQDKATLEQEKADLAKVWSEIDALKKLLKSGTVSTSQQ